MSIITSKTPIISDINKLTIEDIPIDMETKLLKKWPNWTEINGTYYYYKDFNLNELIGQYLSNLLGISCIHNEIGVIKRKLLEDKILVMSQNFQQEGFTYEFADYESLSDLRKKCLNDDNYQELLDSLAKNYAIDIFMRQYDRESPYNTSYKKSEDGHYSLAPLYDFSKAFGNISVYCTPYFNLLLKSDMHPFWYHFYADIPKSQLMTSPKELYEQLPLLPEYLKKVMDVNLEDIVKQIESDYYLQFSNDIFETYRVEDQKSKELIRRII